MICLRQQCDHNIWLAKRKRAIGDDKMMMMMTLSASVDAYTQSTHQILWPEHESMANN